MNVTYTLRDYLHYGRMVWRNRRRQRLWARRFAAAVGDGTYTMENAAVVQILPTETCNLRCQMCNQWGENGYFLAGARKARHMDPEHLSTLVRGVDPAQSLINVHGGEPFAYKHAETLLELLAEKPYDVMFTTNGTLIDRHLEALARIDNLVFLYSIDGDEETHDQVRGAGNFKKSAQALEALFELRRANGQPMPLVIMNFVVCEYTTEAIDQAWEVARDLGVLALNYNLRWFLEKEVGEAYEEHLEQHFGLRSTGAWRGWITAHADHDYSAAAKSLEGRLRRRWLRPRPPFVFLTPGGFGRREVVRYYRDYLEVFGRDSCFMPFYWARVHSNGDLIYCPGHPDIIAGNVFRDGFEKAFNSEVTIRFRKHILNHRLPICNRCCGLYMTDPGRGDERKVRRNLGLGEVQAHFP